MKSKKWSFFALAAVLVVLLVGCEGTLQPVETTEPALPPWRKAMEYPAYADFFGEDRAYSRVEDGCSWVTTGNGIEELYTLQWDPALPEGTQGNSLYVSGGGLAAPEKVFDSPALQNCTLLACDGKFAYLASRDENAGVVTAVLRLELETGDIRPVLEGDALLDVYLCEGVVLYCVRYTGGQTQICRMYLPEERLDIVYVSEVSAALVRLERPERTLGRVIWSTIRPYMQDMMQSELKNGESKYRFGREPVLALWEKTDPVNDPASRDALYQLAEWISEITGVQAAYSEAVSETMPWLRTEPYPAYDTLFSQDLVYTPEGDDSCSWVVMTEQGGIRYHLERHAELTGVRHSGAKLYIRSDIRQARELIYSSEELEDCCLLSCDGRYAYFGRYAIAGDHSLYRQILQLDLRTKSLTVLVEDVGIGSVYFCGGGVLYYLRWDGEQGQICRMYLPERKEEVLCVPDVLPALLSFHRPTSTLGDITWGTWWPEYIAQAEKELKNPGSEYLNMGAHKQLFQALWAAEDPMYDYLYSQGFNTLCQRISESSEAFRDKWASHGDRYTFHPADGTVSMEETDPVLPKPTLVLSQWQPLPGRAPEQAIEGVHMPENAKAVVYGGDFLPGKLLLIRQNEATVLLDEEILECVAGTDAVYCITADNRLLQVAYDGSVCNTLYAGEETPLAMVQYAMGFVYVARGNEILEINVAAGQYRVLVRQPYLDKLSAYSYQFDRYRRLYFSGKKGRAHGFFEFNFETETLEQQGLAILE